MNSDWLFISSSAGNKMALKVIPTCRYHSCGVDLAILN